MSAGLILAAGFVGSFASNLLALIVWFHFDLDEHWRARAMRRRIERGRVLDKRRHKR